MKARARNVHQSPDFSQDNGSPQDNQEYSNLIRLECFMLGIFDSEGYLRDMRSTTSLYILLFALAAAIVSFVADDGFTKLSVLNRNLDQQRRTNEKLETKVTALREQVKGLQVNPRTIEKAARSELGMARPNEVIVVFEKQDFSGNGG
jgi:cell division protein FtsB